MMDDEKQSAEQAKNVSDVAEEIDEPIVIGEDDPVDENNEWQKKADEYKDLAQRIQAEFDNYRKRNNESVRVARNDGINDFVTALFPVIDSFERGIAAVEDEKAKSGMELICKQIKSVLDRFDVVEIPALGEEFDPQYHHAIAQCEDEENKNKIVEVFQKGYKRKDKVLRAALVKVAQ